MGKRSAEYLRRHLLIRHRCKFHNPLPTLNVGRQDTNECLPRLTSIQAIYVWLDRMIFYSDEANKAEDPSDMILRRHVSFLNDIDDFHGFIEYHGGENDPFVSRFGGLLISSRVLFSG